MGFHYFTFTGTFVVDTAQMQHAMHYHSVKLALVRFSYLFGIREDGIKRNEHIAAYHLATGVVESNDVGEIVMVKKLPVHLDDFIIVAEYIIQAAHNSSMFMSHFNNPVLNFFKIEPGHLDPVI